MRRRKSNFVRRFKKSLTYNEVVLFRVLMKKGLSDFLSVTVNKFSMVRKEKYVEERRKWRLHFPKLVGCS